MQLFVSTAADCSETMHYHPALEAAGTVAVVESTDVVLELLKSGRQFDALFSDVVMPGAISGIDLAQWARQHLPGLKILLATGYSDRRIALQGVRILAKPYTVADVMQALGQELQAVS
jgi:CheY-like chemotaxis protein